MQKWQNQPFPKQTVKAKEKTFLIKLTADKLYGLMALHPSLAYAFLGTISHQLRMAQKNEQST